MKIKRKRIAGLALALALCLNGTGTQIFADTGNAAADTKEEIQVAVTMEKLTLGQGFIIEPTLVRLPADSKTLASRVIVDLIEERYPEVESPVRMTGSIDSGFYLSSVYDPDRGRPDIPQYILDVVGDRINYDSSEDDYLGEFDYLSTSGWMYCVGTAEKTGDASFPGVGAASWTMEDGQVMRWQFTLYGYGADLNADNSAWGQESIVNAGDKDALVWAVAVLNDKYERESLNAIPEYQGAMNTLKDPSAVQTKVDQALEDLSKADLSKASEKSQEEKPGTAPSVSFTDMAGHWAESVVSELASKGIVSGSASGSFYPEASITRAEFVQILYNMSGAPGVSTSSAYEDVKDDQWYFKAITWAAQEGIVSGFKETDGAAVFRPEEAVSRQDMAVILSNYLDKTATSELSQKAEPVEFLDEGSIADYAKDSVEKLQKGGVLSGVKTAEGSRFNPQAHATRAEAASMIAGCL